MQQIQICKNEGNIQDFYAMFAYHPGMLTTLIRGWSAVVQNGVDLLSYVAAPVCQRAETAHAFLSIDARGRPKFPTSSYQRHVVSTLLEPRCRGVTLQQESQAVGQDGCPQVARCPAT